MSTIFFLSHRPNAYKKENWRHIFSQWYIDEAPFVGNKTVIHNLDEFISPEIYEKYVVNKKFLMREQWMMYLKALVFSKNDIENLNIANKIISTKDQRTIKNLGRSVLMFNESIWNECKYKIVVNGNYLQFSQNKKMNDILKLTNKREIVEASSYDNIWGIGFSESNALTIERDKWGQNLLGKAIMEVREKLFT